MGRSSADQTQAVEPLDTHGLADLFNHVDFTIGEFVVRLSYGEPPAQNQDRTFDVFSAERDGIEGFFLGTLKIG